MTALSVQSASPTDQTTIEAPDGMVLPCGMVLPEEILRRNIRLIDEICRS